MATRNKNTSETAVVSYVSGDGGYSSCFDGNTWQLIGWRILAGLLIGITLGIGTPWAVCMLQRWETKHTVINGRRLKFTGKGIQLLGKYLLWCLLTVITFGIYGIWFGLKMKKWVVKHTVYADDANPVESYFSGGAGGFLGIHLLAGLITAVTLGIGAAWGEKKIMQWEAKHTHIGGSPLEFNGTGGQLFGKYLLFILLTPLTLGIYALFFPVSLLKWQYAHTDAVYRTPRIQAMARAHEPGAMQDYSRFRLAANDTEVAVLKSGITGAESYIEMEAKAAQGNPYAKYLLFLQLPAEDPRSAEYLQAAADAGYGPAQYVLAAQNRDPRRMIAAAQAGCPEAVWWLENYYESVGELQTAAYWFKIALEWQEPNALSAQSQYFVLLTRIALALSEQQAPQQKKFSALPIILGVVAGILVLGGILVSLWLFMPKGVERPGSQDHNDNILDADTTGRDETQPPALTQDSLSTQPAADAIVGTWTTVFKGGTLYVNSITLNPDGTCGTSSMTYSQSTGSDPVELTVYGQNWYVDGGGGRDGGTYTVEGNTLTLTFPVDMQHPWETVNTYDFRLEGGNLVLLYPSYGSGYEGFTGDSVFWPGGAPNYEQAQLLPEKTDGSGASSFDGALVNTWVKAYRVGTEIWVETLSLKQDGSLEWYSVSYQHASYTGFQGQTGWYETPMGNPISRGSYAADDANSTLTITVTGDDIVPNFTNPIIQTWAVTHVDSETLTVNNGTPYYTHRGYDFETLCRMCGVDMSTPN